MSDTDLIEVLVTRNGIKEPPRYFPIERLQELMDRANTAFGNPEVQLGGPEASKPEGKPAHRVRVSRRR